MNIDEYLKYGEKNNLYSRQIKTYGESMTEKLYKLKILVIGLEGLGIETAKNLILSGVEKVFLFDSETVKINYLGNNYYLSEKNIGKDRIDKSCLNELNELNNYTLVKTLSEYNDMSQIFENILNLNINVVIITKIISFENLKRFNHICRNNNIKFIYSHIFGLCSFIFSDFGNEHYTYKNLSNNSEIYNCINITNEKSPLVTIDNNNNNLSLKDGDYVIFKNLKGMEEMNQDIPKKVKYNDSKSFYLIDLDTTHFSKYIKGGLIYKLDNVKKYEFKSFEESIKMPFHLNDLEHLEGFCEEYEKKLGRNLLIFIIIYYIHEYFSKNNELPNIKNDFKDILFECKKLYDKMPKIEEKNIYDEDYQKFDEEFVLNIINWSEIQIAPICSILGGFLSQEAIKGIGLYSPINQWKFFDFYENKIISYNKENNDKTKNINIKESRYKNQISIFGDEIQKKLEQLNIFLIGAGALGCEILKNLAMMGVSTETNSLVTVTDDDIIELSNLNRQFLFKNSDIKKYKSQIACNNIRKINNKFQCLDYQKKVCENEDHFFNQKFWSKQDLVIVAVDNIEARRYIYSKCIKYEKTLINSATLGTEGKTELMIPHKTYELQINYEEEESQKMPMCTLHGIPKNIKHCLEWSKHLFNNLFGIYINEINKFLNDRKIELFFEDGTTLDKKNEKYYIFNSYFNLIFNKNEFEKKTINLSKYLIYTYFIKNKDNPIDIHFNKEKFNNKMVYQFIISFIYIISEILYFPFNLTNINELIFQNNNLEYKENENEYLNISELKLKNELFHNQFNNKEYKLNLIPRFYDKDNDSIYTYFIQACSNMRAYNFKIKEINYNQALLTLSKIIPAVPTTTSSVAGYLCLQIYFLLKYNDITSLKNSQMDLSLKELFTYDLEPPNFIDYNIESLNNKFTIWDKIIIEKKKTCQEIINYIKNIYNFDINYISIDGIIIIHLRKTNDLRLIGNNKFLLTQYIEDIYYKKKSLLKGYKNEFGKDKYLFIQVYGKYKDKKINSFPLIKYLIN